MQTIERHFPKHARGGQHRPQHMQLSVRRGDHAVPPTPVLEWIGNTYNQFEASLHRAGEAAAKPLLVSSVAAIAILFHEVGSAKPAGNTPTGVAVLACSDADERNFIGYTADNRFTEVDLPELERQARIAAEVTLEELGELDLGGVERGTSQFLGDADDPADLDIGDLVCQAPEGDYRVSGAGQISLLEISRAGIEMEVNRQNGTFFAEVDDQGFTTIDIFSPRVKQIFAAR